MRLHIQAYHLGRLYDCKQCDFQTNRKSNLGQHYKYKHSSVIYACSKCEFKSKISSKVKVHEKTHEENYVPPESKTPHTCPDCHKVLKNKNSLNIHKKRMHTEQMKNFHCVLCGKRDMTKQQLLNHNRTHREKIPSACSICNKNFSSKDSASEHYRNYHTEKYTAKDFTCDQCGKSDLTKIALYDHKRSFHKKIIETLQ